MSELSRTETRELIECETVIQRGLATFIEVGSALLKIRDSRLYRASHGTFENYCQKRWQMSKPYATRMIQAAGVIENLVPIGTIPDSESVARPLAPLPPDQQRDAWKKATEEYGQPTAAQVKATVDEMFPRHEPLNGQGKLFDGEPPVAKEKTPDEQTSGLLAWLRKQTEDWLLSWVSFDRMGGVDKLTRNMTQDQIQSWIESLERFVERSQDYIALLQEKLR